MSSTRQAEANKEWFAVYYRYIAIKGLEPLETHMQCGLAGLIESQAVVQGLSEPVLLSAKMSSTDTYLIPENST